MGNELFYYELYGLKVKSNMEFIQLLPIQEFSSKEADIEIVLENGSELSKTKEELMASGNNYGKTDNGIWFNNQAGKFVIETNGKKSLMKCTKYADVHESIVRSFLLGNSLAIVMTQRGRLAIHGSTLVIDDKAIIVCGGSGAGKSTISMGLIDKGAKLMADDISIIDIDSFGKNIIAYPGFPEQKLCKDAAVDRGLDLESLRFVNEDHDKYAVDRQGIFVNRCLPISEMYILHLWDCEKVQMEEIAGEDKLNAITDNLFLKDIYGSMLILSPMDVLKCVKMAAQVNIHEITRPRGKNTKTEIIDMIWNSV